LLEKDELLKIVWPDTIVEEVNLANNVSILRKVLGGVADEERFIETVPRRGYRFLADVKIVVDEKPAGKKQENWILRLGPRRANKQPKRQEQPPPSAPTTPWQTPAGPGGVRF
jgi:DNA-binding winged helix-turn-helix (wHTH) protein